MPGHATDRPEILVEEPECNTRQDCIDLLPDISNNFTNNQPETEEPVASSITNHAAA